jgi:predicted ATPase/Tfp pilus assembly protein PilF
MRLQTLGGLALSDVAFARAKPLLLLAYLAMEGARTRRELADLFFLGTRDPRDGLSTALRRIAAVAPGAFVLEKEWVRATLACDALEIQEAIEAHDAARAVRLYRGPFLQGIDLTLGLELEEWVFATRERTAGVVREAHLHIADEASRQGAIITAAKHVEAALKIAEAPELEPEEHDRLRQLVSASRRSRTKRISVPYLERGPGPPMSSAAFVGRQRELDQIGSLLVDPTCRLLTLLGPGGIGKSRLALRATEDALREEAFRDGATLIELSALTSAQQIVPTIAGSVSCLFHGQGEELAQLTDHLADRNLLLVLDNFEHLMEAAMLPADLLAHCPDLTILVTSREPLRLQQEHVLSVGGLEVPRAEVGPDEARRSDAVRLFLLRARQVRQDEPLADADVPDVVRVCEIVEGSPLALELAAAWVRTMPVSAVAAEIAANLDLLTSGARDAPERHQSMRVVLAHSWTLLTDRDRTALRRLSVFRGGFTADAAERVAGAPHALLALLVEKSVLHAVDRERLDFHPLVQAFALERLQEDPDEERRARERHARHYFAFVSQHHQAFLNKDRRGEFAILERELGNVRAAWAWGAKERWAAQLHVASPLLRHAFDKRGQCQEGARLFEQAVVALDSDDPTHRVARGRILIDQAHFHHYLGNHLEAIRRVQSGLKLLEGFGALVDVRDGLNLLGGATGRAGDYEEAKRIAERSLAISCSLGDDRGITNSLSYLALIEQMLGDYEDAEVHCRRSLALCRRSGNEAQTVIVLKTYGSLLQAMGRAQEASAVLEEALALAQETDYPRVTCDILTNLALAALELGRAQEARAFAREAVDRAAASGIQTFEALALVALSRSETALGSHADAREHIAQGLTWARELHNAPLTISFYAALGESCAACGSADDARRILEYVQRQPSLEAAIRRLAERSLLDLGTVADSNDMSAPDEIEVLVHEILAPADGTGARRTG